MKENHLMEIKCKHGTGIAAISCCHIMESAEPVGFVENSATLGDLQAWCLKCEEFFLQEGGNMTTSFKKFTKAMVVCEECYKEAKARHEI